MDAVPHSSPWSLLGHRLPVPSQRPLSPLTTATPQLCVQWRWSISYCLHQRIMFPVYILKRNVSKLYGNKTCLKIWNSAAASLFFWYLYFHMLNDLYIC